MESISIAAVASILCLETTRGRRLRARTSDEFCANSASSTRYVGHKHWRRIFQDKLFQALSWYEERVLYPPLPSVLRNHEQRPFSIHRLRAAMARITQKSLIVSRRKNGTDVYSMHPLIHRWVRERPGMTLSERALWCQAAVTMMNQCIPLPPQGGEDSDMQFRRASCCRTLMP